MDSISIWLYKNQDLEFRSFQMKLIPNVNSSTIIGVRTPILRKYAKELVRTNNYIEFINNLPHQYFEENQLHAFILSELREFSECIDYVNIFLPYIDNWATCDQLSPHIFKKNLDKLYNQIIIWMSSCDEFTVRFGIRMLMNYFLDDRFKDEYLYLVSSIKSNDYYVNMMIAWFFATALAKQYDSTIVVLKNNLLDSWTHNMTIKKAIESYRIDERRKKIIMSFKRNIN